MFQQLSPEQTGLQLVNRYDDPQMWASRYRAFMGGAMGSGVAAGDFDGDGQVDLYVSTKTKPGRLFKNLGGWRFTDVTDSAGLAETGSWFTKLRSSVSEEKPIWHQGATFADVDNDGWLDLYIARNDAPNLLYINQGDGTFREEAQKRGLAIIDGSVIGCFADFDRDGHLDLFLLTNQVDGLEPGGRPDRLFRNAGNGTFAEVTANSGISGPTFGHAAVWFDYDGDLWPDIYVANDFSGPDRLYRNNRNGTFTNVLDQAVPHTPYSSMGADTGDINNDGLIDLLVADMAPTTREKDRRGLAASRNDVLATLTADQTAPQYMRNALYLNAGQGVFREAACWAGIDATDWTWSVRFEDFDNDGWADLHVTNGMVREANNSDLLSDMMRALSDMQRINTMKRSPPLAEANLAYRNRGDGRFEPVTAEWGLGEVGVSFGAATADLDNDGDLDLVYLSYDGGLSVFRNDTTGRHRIQIRLRGTRSNRYGIGAILTAETSAGTQAQTLTVARGYASSSETVAHFGLGSDATMKRLTIRWPSGVVQVLENLKADHAYTITEKDSGASPPPSPAPLYAPDKTFAALEHADRSRPTFTEKEQSFLPFRTDRRGPALAIADLDGDMQDEFWLSATTGSPARVLRWTGKDYVAEAPRGIPASPIEDGPALLFDADGNGTPDLLLTKASADATAWPAAYQPVLYSNRGRGEFTATNAIPALAINAGAACAADLDGDGDLDLFIGGRSIPGRYPEIPSSIILRNDGGRFSDISGESPVLARLGLVKGALFEDLDQDGRPDLVVALEWDPVRFLRNDGQGRFEDHTEASGFSSGGHGWWNSLASADFNRDGRPDLVAGNLGRNTPYKATREHPATLLYGDFARNGSRLIVEAVHDGDQLYPLRARSELGTRLPAVLRRYPKNNDFARAPLNDIFAEELVTAADVRTAGNFDSGVFLSQPDGTYRFEPLPPLAQIGPILGVVALDVDGDGSADIAAVQNSDANVPRFDGGVGLLLKGNGQGQFAAQHPSESGMLARGQGRALAAFAPPGRFQPDLFLTRHGGLAAHLGNHAPVRWLRLRLAGAPGNPAAVGARVRISYANRPPTHHTLHIGSGWWTQSAPEIFVGLPQGEAITQTSVIWPDGHTTTHADAPHEGSWTLQRAR